MRRFQERLCLGLAVLLLTTGFCVFITLVLDIHKVRVVPSWLKDIVFVLINLEFPILKRFAFEDATLTTCLAASAVYWIPGMISLFVSHYLRTQRIHDEMALK